MICPYCNAENPDGSRFCDACEKPLTAVASAPAEPKPAAPEAEKHSASEVEIMAQRASTEWPGQDNRQPLDMGEIEREARQRVAAMKQGSVQETAKPSLLRIQSGDGTGEVAVQYAVNRIFLPGGQVNLEFQVYGTREPLQAVYAWLSMVVAGKKEVLKGECRAEDKGYRGQFACYLEKDSICGNVQVHCHLACRWQGRLEFYAFEANHEILAKNLSAREIHNTFTLSDGSLIKDMNIQNSDSSDDFARRMNSQPPQFESVKVYSSNWRPEESVSIGDYSHPEPMESMTLLFEQFAVYVTSKPVVRMGRRPSTNDFAVMDWKNNQQPNQAPTATVSRDQLELRNCGDSILLYTEKETTLLDGVSPEIGGAGGMVLRESCRLSMGEISLRMRIHSCNMRRNSPMCINCMAQKMRSVTLAREDGLPEGFAIVWECCELGTLNPALEGFTLYHRNGGFLLATPDKKLYNLVAGEVFSSAGKRIKVCHFGQRLIGNTFPF